jgi:hypothetical protein
VLEYHDPGDEKKTLDKEQGPKEPTVGWAACDAGHAKHMEVRCRSEGVHKRDAAVLPFLWYHSFFLNTLDTPVCHFSYPRPYIHEPSAR